MTKTTTQKPATTAKTTTLKGKKGFAAAAAAAAIADIENAKQLKQAVTQTPPEAAGPAAKVKDAPAGEDGKATTAGPAPEAPNQDEATSPATETPAPAADTDAAPASATITDTTDGATDADDTTTAHDANKEKDTMDEKQTTLYNDRKHAFAEVTGNVAGTTAPEAKAEGADAPAPATSTTTKAVIAALAEGKKQSRNQTKDKPTVAFRFTPELVKRLKKQWRNLITVEDNEDLTLSDVAERAIAFYLDAKEEETRAAAREAI